MGVARIPGQGARGGGTETGHGRHNTFNKFRGIIIGKHGIHCENSDVAIF